MGGFQSMSDNALQGLACPSCGGTVVIPEGQVLVICPSCGQRAVVSGDRGVMRYQVPLRVDRAKAEEALRGFLGSNMQIAAGLRRTAQISESFLVHLPFWSAWGRGAAWTFGQEKVGSGENSHYEPREKQVVKDLQWNGVACDVGEFGVRRISLEGRALEPFQSEQLHRSGMVFEPVGAEEEAFEQAQNAFQENVRQDTAVDRTAQTFARILAPRQGVVYYPVWVLRYLFKGRSFQVVVDGFDGGVLYGKAPGNVLFRAAALVGGMAVGAFLAIDVPAIILSSTSSNSHDSPIGFAFAIFAIGAGLMYAGYRRFSYCEK
jgi:predicted RNA-binding Zn-ribbon protein involved in translation (DUF1610 family)